MHQRLIFPTLLLLLTGAVLLSNSSAAGTVQETAELSPTAEIEQMEWLAGTWSGAMWGGRFEAHYSSAAGGRILSHSRLFIKDDVRFYEFEVFEPKDSVVYLQPYPGGKAATGFALESHDSEARKAIFENPKKDYPTRIVYERVGQDQLVITLTDPHGESDKVERFELKRLP